MSLYNSSEEGYKKIEHLGKGAYGSVYRAEHNCTKEVFAIKKIVHNDENMMCPTTIREIGILKSIKHANIVQLKSIYIDGESGIFLVFENMECDLKKFYNSAYAYLTASFHKNILRQIISAAEYLHELGLIHRDIKPQNILIRYSGSKSLCNMKERDRQRAYINGNFIVKLADLGLSRAMYTSKKKLTREVITLWYRPIEVLLGCYDYGNGVDMWGIGCVFAEMITNEPLFRGDCSFGTIMKICELLGTPAKGVITQFEYFQTSFPKFKKNSIIELFPALRNLSKAGIDLLKKMIVLNPNQRISATEALKHPYLNQEIDII